jgi:hypothetical protein
MAGTTGLEPATSAVTGQRSNQLSYVPTCSLCNLKNIPSEAYLFPYPGPFPPLGPLLQTTFKPDWAPSDLLQQQD